MRVMRQPGPIALLVALAACTDPSTSSRSPVPPAVFRLAAPDAWSGGAVTVFSSTPLPSTLPTVSVGGQAVTVTRVNDTTLRAALPAAVGPMTVVVAGAQDTLRAAVTLHGFEAMGTLFGVWGVLSPFPGAAAAVIGNGAAGVVTADLHTGTVTTYPDSMHSSSCGWGPGVTPDSAQFILQTPNGASACANARWAIAPSPLMLETTPPFSTAESDNRRVIAELAPRRWLVSEKYDIALWICDTGCVLSYLDNLPAAPDVAGRIDGVHLSPRGDRAAVDVYYDQRATGIPVIDAQTARVAYWKPTMAWSEGAAFSPHGDTLFIAGGDSATGGQSWMFVLRASDGAVMDSVPLAVRPGDVALDPAGRWIYVSGVSHSYHVSYWSVAAALEVIDRGTMQAVTVILSDSIQVLGGVWDKHRIVLDPADRQMFVVTTDIYIVPDSIPTDATARVFRFSTPP
jgi:hypothetical protein